MNTIDVFHEEVRTAAYSQVSRGKLHCALNLSPAQSEQAKKITTLLSQHPLISKVENQQLYIDFSQFSGKVLSDLKAKFAQPNVPDNLGNQIILAFLEIEQTQFSEADERIRTMVEIAPYQDIWSVNVGRLKHPSAIMRLKDEWSACGYSLTDPKFEGEEGVIEVSRVKKTLEETLKELESNSTDGVDKKALDPLIEKHGLENLLKLTLKEDQRTIFAYLLGQFMYKNGFNSQYATYINQAYKDLFSLEDGKEKIIHFFRTSGHRGIYPNYSTVIHLELYSKSSVLRVAIDNYLNLLRTIIHEGAEKNCLKRWLLGSFKPGMPCLEGRTIQAQDYLSKDALFDLDYVINFDKAHNIYQNVSQHLLVYRNRKAVEFAQKHPEKYPKVDLKSKEWLGPKGMRITILDSDPEFREEYLKPEVFEKFLKDEQLEGLTCTEDKKLHKITADDIKKCVARLDDEGLI